MWTVKKRNWNHRSNNGSSKQTSKPAKRKQYNSSEFKHEAVRLVTEGGLSIAQVTRDLGLSDNMVSRWKPEATQNGQRAFLGRGHPQDEELSRRRREVEVLW